MFKAFNKGELRYYDLFHQDKDYEAEAKSLPLTGRTVLEIGSGTGLMTKELEKLGYRVTTVDPNCRATYNTIDEIPNLDRFDNIIALYDVLNYIKDKPDTTGWITETWNKSQGVKPFTYKKADNYHRVRLGIKLGNTAHLLFIYWGKGIEMAYHKLYL